MRFFQKILICSVLSLLSWSAFSQDIERDSIFLQEALKVVKDYNANDSLRNAMRILQDQILKDRTAKALEVLQKADTATLKQIGGKSYVDSIINSINRDEYYHWFRKLARDSVKLSLYDVEGNRTNIWTNTPEMRSTRYWLYKSATDSLGFWLYSLPTEGIMLVPDFDVYQEKKLAEYRSSIMMPIPIKENPEQYKLVPFQKYKRIIIPWKKGVVANVGFSQSYFQHWIKGGENNIASNIDILAFANYKKGKVEWENYLRWKLGLIQSEKIDEIIRNEDLLEFNSKYGLRASKKWFYSTQLNFKTQLFHGFSYKDGKERVSDFLSPAYGSLALGMDYKPNKKLSLLLAPITGRIIYMRDIATLEETTYGIDKGKHIWQQLGPYLRVKWNDKFFKSLTVDTSLELFSNYFEDFGNIDVDWSTAIDLRINYFMSTRLSFKMLYDDDVEIPLYETVNGTKEQIGVGQRLQFNQNFAISFVFRI